MRSSKLAAYDIHRFNPLDPGQFRVFELQPSPESTAPLTGALHHVSLPKESYIESYEALSYTWGKPGDTGFVYIDGRRHRIWKVLHDALSAIRHVDTPLFLFVDAICINMADLSERNDQISALRPIFQGADQVRIWLGEAEENAPATFEFLEELSLTNNLDDLLRTSKAKAALFGAGSLLSREWFTRVWTVQELVLAKQATLHVGSHSIRWEAFHIATEILDQKRIGFPPELDYQQIQKATQVLRLLKRSFERDQHRRPTRALLSLETLVTNLSNLRPTDPRDLIYALVGISSDGVDLGSSKIHALVAPDYTISVQEVYERFIQFCVEKSGSLDILFRPWVPQNLFQTLPYWMWTANITPNGSSATGFSFVSTAGEQPLYTAGPTSDVAANFGPDGKLQVWGQMSMWIEDMAPPADGRTIPTQWSSFSDLSRFDFYRLLLGNRDDDGLEFTDDSYGSYFRDRLSTDDTDRIYKEGGTMNKSKRYHTLRRLNSLTYNRKLAYCTNVLETKSNALALVPVGAKLHDSICILNGCSVPVVLRFISSYGNRHLCQLIGHCYVHNEAVMSFGGPKTGFANIFEFARSPPEVSTESVQDSAQDSDDSSGDERVDLLGKIPSHLPASKLPRRTPALVSGRPIGTTYTEPMVFTTPITFKAPVIATAPVSFTAPVTSTASVTSTGASTFTAPVTYEGPTTYTALVTYAAPVEFDGAVTYSGPVTYTESPKFSTAFGAASDNPVKLYRMQWICTCGHRGLDQFIEQRPGAVTEMAERFRKRGVEVALETWNPSEGFSDSIKLALQQMQVGLLNQINDGMRHFGIQRRTPHPNSRNASTLGVKSFQSGGQGTSTGPPGKTSVKATVSASSSQSSSQGQGSSKPSGSTSRPPQAVQPPQTQGQGPKIVQVNQTDDFLMICIKGKKPYRERRDIKVSMFTKDREVFEEIGAEYGRFVSRWRRWLSFLSVQNISFVQFTFRPRGLDGIKSDMPPLTAQHYAFNPRPVDTLPPIGRDWMMHLFKNPDACEDDEWCLEQFAKREDGPAVANQAPDAHIGWGLHLEEGFDWGTLVIYFVLGAIGSLGFGITWAVVKGSIQDGFAVAGYVLTLEAITVATLQTILMTGLG